MQFFKTTAQYKEMLLLEFIEENENISQPDIARHIGASASMVNGYIDDLEKKCFLKRNYMSLKNVEYNITLLGIKRKNFLQIIYMKELMKLYLEGKEKVFHFLASIVEKGFKNVVFYGAGEVAEILLGIIKINDIDINVVCILDDDEKKQGRKLNGIKICSFGDFKNHNHDGLIITSYTYEKEIITKLNKARYPSDKIVRYFEI